MSNEMCHLKPLDDGYDVIIEDGGNPPVRCEVQIHKDGEVQQTSGVSRNPSNLSEPQWQVTL